MSTANWSVIALGRRIIHDIIHINNTYIRVRSQPDRHTCSLYYGHSRHARTCYHLSLYRPTTFMHFISRDSGSKQISFITEGLPWKITVNNWSIQKKKQREWRSRCIKKEREHYSLGAEVSIPHHNGQFCRIVCELSLRILMCILPFLYPSNRVRTGVLNRLWLDLVFSLTTGLVLFNQNIRVTFEVVKVRSLSNNIFSVRVRTNSIDQPLCTVREHGE